MKLAIAQYVGSFEALARQLDYAAISDDPENYHRCVARERTLEIEACREMGFPLFFIIDTPDTRSIRLAGQGGQDLFRRHLLYDADHQPVDSLAGYEVLLRTSVSQERSVLTFIESLDGKNIADWQSQVLTLEWYKHICPEYLKRHLAWFRIDEIHRQDLDRFKDDQGRFFCKTNYKALSGVTANLVDFLGYATETMPPSTEIIISETLDLQTDAKGKLEYRCFIVRGRLTSISRYIDYDTNYEIPAEITAFAEAFVTAHQTILPDYYVLDVAECSRRGPVVIELNGIVASGRYEKNDFRKLLADMAA